MSFFDDKEEVINIELTQYGKKLLSQGKFKPVFYSFHDDDILYDSTFGGFIDEKQNKIEERIFNETPAFKSFYNYIPLENDLKLKDQNIKTKNLVLTPLGNSSYNSSYYPSFDLITKWQISKFFEEEVLQDENKMRINSFKIPQIILEDMYYKVIAEKSERTGCNALPKIGEFLLSDLGRIYHFFDILEKNVNLQDEYFDLEVYIEETETKAQSTTPVKYWRQLYFREKINNNITYKIEKNILYDSNEISSQNIKNLLDVTDYVETFLDIKFDDAAERNAKNIDKTCPDVPKSGGGGGGGGGSNGRNPRDPTNFKRTGKDAEKDAIEYCK